MKKIKRLPRNVKITDGIIDKYTAEAICEAINDFLAEKYGYCVNSYGYDITINVDNIDWDTDDDYE